MPDLLLWFGLQALTGSFLWTFVLYATAQVAVFALLGGRLAGPLAGRPWPEASWLVLATLTAALALCQRTYPDTQLRQALVPVVHMGPVLLSLVGLGLVLSLARRWGAGGALGLLALVFAAVLSNRGFLAVFVAPLAVALAGAVGLGAMPWRRCLAIALLCALGVALAPLADPFITRQPDVPFEVDPTHLAAFARNLPVYLGWPGLLTTIVAPLLLWAALPAVRPLRRLFEAAEFWFVWAFSLLAAGASLALDALRYEGGASPSRYAAALAFWAVLWTAILVLRLIPAPAARLAPLAAAAALALVPLSGRALTLHPRLLDWRYPAASCLDRARAEHGLRAGLAHYWEASPLTASLGWTLPVRQIDTDATATLWGNNPLRTTRSVSGSGSPPSYDFIVMEQIDPAAARAAYGEPDQVIDCDGRPVWLYRDGEGLARRLIERSPQMRPFR